ncbi:MAG: type II CAAX prenyl endopeptidase Rce1 family protein [Spirochaetia bacterium]
MITEAALTIVEYLIRISPGLILAAMVFLIVKPGKIARVGTYIFLFILFRDALTPLGLWSFGSQGFFWIRLHSNPVFLVLFGVFSAVLMGSIIYLDRENKKYIVLFRNSKLVGILTGIAGAAVVVLPLGIVYRFVDIASRGGSVPFSLVLPILVFALLGNFLEEGLFRGYVYGLLAERQKPIIAGISSGIVFAFCHILLAVTVTDIGYPLLAFALYEGIIAGIVGSKYGIIPATLTHGGAIFLLSSGLL